jgi:hypothetical protein
MKEETKKRIIWISYAIASVTAISGIFIHPAVNMAGIIMLVCIMVFCMMDE